MLAISNAVVRRYDPSLATETITHIDILRSLDSCISEIATHGGTVDFFADPATYHALKKQQVPAKCTL